MKQYVKFTLLSQLQVHRLHEKSYAISLFLSIICYFFHMLFLSGHSRASGTGGFFSTSG